MAEPAADELPPVPPSTTMTDRDLLIHTLTHVEQIHARLEEFAALLDELGPLIERARRHGGRGTRLFGGSPPPGSRTG